MPYNTVGDVDNFIDTWKRNVAKGLPTTGVLIELEKEKFDRLREEARCHQRLDYMPGDDRCTQFHIDEAIIRLKSSN